ncbi:hypothetical protein FGIG_02623 [Fasciola gigantica]|uniref:PDZ domain-containing protein n=1 Tax=Fasciola gigantica TaxID=46835 RepID=A0A504Y977_FASGI|nr:hypothetical protein FGIG_02623 [Fasciola gigantica]
MLHTCGDGGDFRSRNDQPVLNGILVTPDDLYDSRKTSSSASTSLYVKPLTSESRDGGTGIQDRDHRDRSSGTMNKANRILESVNRGSFVHDSPRDTTHQRTNLQNFSKPNLRTASPAFSRMHRSSFKRDSAVRRSLGGTAIPPSWLNEDPLSVYDTSRTHVSQTPSAHSPSKPDKDLLDLDLAPLLHIRVVRLPSLDDLGFSLDSYSQPSTGHFLGLRLCDRFQSRKIHFEARDNCPFEAGDLIVSVNQHRLSSMHESQAIRYVCNAFRDAQQYTVEFGVFRLPHESEKTSSARSPQKQYYEPSTLPNRTSHAKRFSTAYQLKTVHVSDAKEVEATQHQPRRVQPSRNSIISESVGIPNSPRRSYCKWL